MSMLSFGVSSIPFIFSIVLSPSSALMSFSKYSLSIFKDDDVFKRFFQSFIVFDSLRCMCLFVSLEDI
jgi:ATP/ADP translocase